MRIPSRRQYKNPSTLKLNTVASGIPFVVRLLNTGRWSSRHKRYHIYVEHTLGMKSIMSKTHDVYGGELQIAEFLAAYPIFLDEHLGPIVSSFKAKADDLLAKKKPSRIKPPAIFLNLIKNRSTRPNGELNK